MYAIYITKQIYNIYSGRIRSTIVVQVQFWIFKLDWIRNPFFASWVPPDPLTALE